MVSKLRAGEFSTPLFLGICGTFFAFTVTVLRGIENTGIQDAVDYVSQGRSMLHGWTFMQSNPDLFQRPLALPFVVAATFLLTNSSSLLLTKILLAIGHGTSTYLMARIGKQMGLRKPLWLLGAICFSLDPFIFFSATDVQTESITTLIVLYWAFLYLAPLVHTRSAKVHVICFLFTGFLAISMRPNFVLPFAFIAIILCVRWIQQGVRLSLLVLSTSIFLSLISFYEVLLTRLYGGFVFLSPIGGWNAVFTCRTEFMPQYLGIASSRQNASINSWVGTHLKETITGILTNHPNLPTSALNHELYNVGISTCLKNPIQSAGVLIVKIFALWRPFTVFGAYSFKIFLFSLLLWVPLTIVTIWFIAHRRLSTTNILLRNYFVILATAFTISLLLTPTQIRHRIAFAEPFYWLFLMYFLENILGIRRSLSRNDPNNSRKLNYRNLLIVRQR